MKNPTSVERKFERELVVTRTFNGPARIVFEAWTKPDLFKQWWLPKSMGMTLRSCEIVGERDILVPRAGRGLLAMLEYAAPGQSWPTLMPDPEVLSGRRGMASTGVYKLAHDFG